MKNKSLNTAMSLDEFLKEREMLKEERKDTRRLIRDYILRQKGSLQPKHLNTETCAK